MNGAGISNFEMSSMKGQGMEYNFYGIYGFLLAVEDSVNAQFEKEYRRFKLHSDDVEGDVNLYVKELREQQRILPTRLRGDNKGILLPFGRDNNRALYNRGVDSVFVLQMLEPFLRWKDKCFLHAGAVSKNGKAAVFPAAPDTGKTSIVLELLQRGFDYLSDDFLIIGNGKAYPFPKPLNIFDYNLVNNKAVAKRVLKWRYAFFTFYKLYFRLRRFLKAHLPFRLARRMVDFLPQNVYSIDIQGLFPDANIAGISAISSFFFLELSHEDEIRITRMDSEELARKMAYMNLLHRDRMLMEYYHYAFENAPDEKVEKMFDRDKEIMLNSFRKAKVYRVLIPESQRALGVYAQLAAIVASYSQ